MNYAVQIPTILLPKTKNISTWSVIACDQYTQDEGYWKKALAETKGEPSTINLILPEIFLEKENADLRTKRIQKIHKTMKTYLETNIFDSEQKMGVYIERETRFGRKRRGLVLLLDLECYDWRVEKKALVRATEETIASRIPPRKAIREGAPLESPHILLLANDKDRIFIEKIGNLVRQTPPVYDGDLMLGGGHITGWAVKGNAIEVELENSLKTLYKNGSEIDGSTLLFAVGDGNHSLATAKAVWEEQKSLGITDSPARYALVEIVNIFDEGLTFEPIHRVVFGANSDNLKDFLSDRLNGKLEAVSDFYELEKKVHSSVADFGIALKNISGNLNFFVLHTNIKDLAIVHLQKALDSFVKDKNENSENKISMDYIHGSDEVKRLSSLENTIGILLPPIVKDSFFTTIQKTGSLPRKSFSMGEADEKRFYLECRKLFSD